MYCPTIDCEHLNEIEDQQEGSIVCTDCGLVISDQYFVAHYTPLQPDESNFANIRWLEKTKDILDKIHMPLTFAEPIVNRFQIDYKRKTLKNLTFSMYKVLNEVLGVSISLQEISNITGLVKTDIYAAQQFDDNMFMDTSANVEKYCKMLNLDFKTTTLIKARIESVHPSGHSPLTILASTIYLVCKEIKKKKISIKTVANITSTSCISIQRYIKKNANAIS